MPTSTIPPARLSTGVDGLDALLGGGLLPGTLAVIVGATGVGKTQLGLQFAAAGERQEGRRGGGVGRPFGQGEAGPLCRPARGRVPRHRLSQGAQSRAGSARERGARGLGREAAAASQRSRSS